MKKFILSLFCIVVFSAGCGTLKQSPSGTGIKQNLNPQTITDQKFNTQTYENKEWGFKFSYPANWQIQPGEESNFSPKPKLYLKLVNTKDFPTRGSQYIEVLMVEKANWEFPGGEGSKELFKQVQSSKNNQILYFNFYQNGSVANYYDHNQKDKSFFEAFNKEGKIASYQLKSIADSLQPN